VQQDVVDYLDGDRAASQRRKAHDWRSSICYWWPNNPGDRLAPHKRDRAPEGRRHAVAEHNPVGASVPLDPHSQAFI